MASNINSTSKVLIHTYHINIYIILWLFFVAFYICLMRNIFIVACCVVYSNTYIGVVCTAQDYTSHGDMHNQRWLTCPFTSWGLGVRWDKTLAIYNTVCTHQQTHKDLLVSVAVSSLLSSACAVCLRLSRHFYFVFPHSFHFNMINWRVAFRPALDFHVGIGRETAHLLWSAFPLILFSTFVLPCAFYARMHYIYEPPFRSTPHHIPSFIQLNLDGFSLSTASDLFVYIILLLFSARFHNLP